MLHKRNICPQKYKVNFCDESRGSSETLTYLRWSHLVKFVTFFFFGQINSGHKKSYSKRLVLLLNFFQNLDHSLPSDQGFRLSLPDLYYGKFCFSFTWIPCSASSWKSAFVRLSLETYINSLISSSSKSPNPAVSIRLTKIYAAIPFPQTRYPLIS